MSVEHQDIQEPHEVDWAYCRRFVRAYVRRRLPSAALADVDDVTSEALVGALREIRRRGPRNLDALLTHAANLRVLDHLRSHYRSRANTDLSGPDSSELAVEAFDGCHRLDLVRFAILEYFGSHSRACLDLARSFFDEQDWRVVADHQQKSHAAIRKQWSRCIDVVRRALTDHSGSTLASVLQEFAP